MLKLYYAPSTCALASHIALEEAGATYETVRLSFKTEDQKKPEYLKINPKARVPSLVTDRGIITETPAILIYIAQTFPAAKLAPLDDPFALARVQAFNSYLCSTVHVAHAHRMRGYRWADDAGRDRAHEEEGAADGRRMLRADRARDVRGPLGDGQGLHGVRRLSVHAHANGSAPTASTSTRRRRSPITSSAPASGRRCSARLPKRSANCRARRKSFSARGRYRALSP